jgi:hypothetical protein
MYPNLKLTPGTGNDSYWRYNTGCERVGLGHTHLKKTGQVLNKEGIQEETESEQEFIGSVDQELLS